MSGFILSYRFSLRREHSRGDMKAYWKIEGDLLKLALEATATGWVAFGLGETTGMKGADIVYFMSMPPSVSPTLTCWQSTPSLSRTSVKIGHS